MSRYRYFACLLFVGTLASMTRPASAQQSKPRVAIFSQSGFPFYSVSPLLAPRALAADLQQSGVEADLLNAAELADPAKFDIHLYSAVVLPYGNTYPQEAFANLQAFHRAGGCLILSGVPFTHAVTRSRDAGGAETWQDLGHNSAPALFGPDGIGVGGFRDGPQETIRVATDDPLDLKSLHRNWPDNQQVLDVSSLPSQDQVVPILVQGSSPVAAVVQHRDPEFSGAIDVWTHHPDTGDYDAYDTEQMLARGTIEALASKGVLTGDQRGRAFAIFGAKPHPMIYANLTLPNPPRPYATFQPKSPPPARHLYVTDVRRLSSDEKILLTSLQGIVNRAQPRIYLVFGDDDLFWLAEMQKQGQTGTPIRVSEPLSLVQTFRREIRGAVTPDPRIYVSPHVAVDFAGLDDLVIATPALAQRLHLAIKVDLRGMFKDDADAYRYVRTHLLHRLNPYLSICLNAPLDSGAIDQIIAARGLCFWVTGPRAQDRPGANESGELAEIKATLAQLPLNAVVRGFWWSGEGYGLDEGPGVSLGSRFGKVTVVTDLVVNYSVLSGVRIASLHQKPLPPPPPLDRSKVYVAITVSDGDNLCTWRGFFRQYFEDPLHGTFPIAWGMGPTLIDVAPTQAKWYYDHAARNEEFLCDVSGVGYIYPPDWATALRDRAGALRSFYDWTRSYMSRMDMKTIRLMGVDAPSIARVGPLLPQIRFMMPDYGYAGETPYDAMTYTLPTGQAVFRAVTGSSANEMAGEIRSRVGATRPAFVNAFIMNWGMKLADLKQMLDALGPDYIAVTPSQLDTLYQQTKRHGEGGPPVSVLSGKP